MLGNFGARDPFPAEITSGFGEKVVGWRLIVGEGELKLQCLWKLRDYKCGVELINRIYKVAEAAGHFPNLHLEQPNQVRAELWTSSIGGLSMNDFIVAAKIDDIKNIRSCAQKKSLGLDEALCLFVAFIKINPQKEHSVVWILPASNYHRGSSFCKNVGRNIILFLYKVKQLTFSAKTLKSALAAVPSQLQTALANPDQGFPYITAIDSLFNDGVKLPKPKTGDRFSWSRDAEFSRQTLAGLNPYSIELVTEWPLKSKLDPEIYGPPESLITTELVEKEIGGCMTVNEALKRKKIFILDYHDLLMPYVNKPLNLLNHPLVTNRNGSKCLPQPWMPPVVGYGCLLKPMFVLNDAGLHQLVNHCSAAYDQLWRIHMEALPADLIRRLPFANDGLILWDAIKEWVSDSVNHYYPDPTLVESDEELQGWWTEVRTKGHADKKDEPWWPVLKTPENLIHILTTIIWVTAGHHAAVNFGQYTYAGYFPNKPTIARTNMPTDDPSDESFKNFLKRPEMTLLNCYPSQIQATQMMVVMDVLSNHSPDEEYLGEKLESSWAENPVIKAAFERFNGNLKKLEGIIDERNTNLNLKNRIGAGVVPYELLKPFSTPGVTGMDKNSEKFQGELGGPMLLAHARRHDKNKKSFNIFTVNR
ncbi:hypothetical protein ACE6H2_005934 [Prunus campanulata]